MWEWAVGSPKPKEIEKICALFRVKSFFVIGEFKLKSNDKYECLSSNSERLHKILW